MTPVYLIVLLIALVSLVLIYSLFKLTNHESKKKEFSVQKITGAAVLSAVEIVMIVVSNYITIGPVNMNLSLVPIAIGALLYGPFVGGFLGLINGAITLLSPSTLAVFMPLSPLGTVLVCLLKTSLAGVIAGYVFLLFKKKQFLGSVIASLLVPIINTGLFVAGSYLFFNSWLNAGAAGYDNTFIFLIMAVMGWNFLIELAISIFLSPTVYQIFRIIKRRHAYR